MILLIHSSQHSGLTPNLWHLINLNSVCLCIGANEIGHWRYSTRRSLLWDTDPLMPRPSLIMTERLLFNYVSPQVYWGHKEWSRLVYATILLIHFNGAVVSLAIYSISLISTLFAPESVQTRSDNSDIEHIAQSHVRHWLSAAKIKLDHDGRTSLLFQDLLRAQRIV